MLVGSGPAGPVGASAGVAPTENKLRGRELPDVDPIWHYGFMFAPALTVGGGTFAVQRNIVAEHVLGLPREPDAEKGLSWRETRNRLAG